MAELSASGAIDVDIHPPLPAIGELVCYLDDYWASQIVSRNIDRAPFAMTSYPPGSPLSLRADWRDASGSADKVERFRREGIDRFGSGLAIANFVHGVAVLNNPDMSAALCAAVNDHMRECWLDRDPRLRGSILVSIEDPHLAAGEIERQASDQRMVQVLLFALQDAPHGNRRYWPIYAAAERHGLAVAIHAGGLYRQAPAVSGWPSFQLEDYVLQSTAFENIVLSLLAEGVFGKFPGLNFVFLESGFAWLPTTLWRVNKTWRGVRSEVPWLDRKPTEILKDRLFVSLQPVDAPDARALRQILKHIGGAGMLLFSTDYPHAQFRGDDPVPDGLQPGERAGILALNALRAYPRLGADSAALELAGRLEKAS